MARRFFRGISRIAACLAGLCAAGALAGCETTRDYGDDNPSISIPYDPDDYDPEELTREAQAHCTAYGLDAAYQDETIDPQSVRWRYRHYICV